MRRFLHSMLVAGSIAMPVSAQATTDPATLQPNSGKKPRQDTEQFAYSIGYMNGETSREQLPDLDLDAFMRGFRDATAKKQSLLSPEERAAAIARYKEARLAQNKAALEKQGKDNAAAASAFLAGNATADGVHVTASGLQYRLITEGTGPKPKATDLVKVNYEGKLLDGTVFDSSYARGEPVTFKLDQVIPGWTEALQLLPVGSTVELFIPAALGYGELGAGPIPPNALLTFKIDLLGIEKAPVTPAKGRAAGGKSRTR